MDIMADGRESIPHCKATILQLKTHLKKILNTRFIIFVCTLVPTIHGYLTH